MSTLSRSSAVRQTLGNGVKRSIFPMPRFLLLFTLFAVVLFFSISAQAQGIMPQDEDLIQGALLYDRWYATLNQEAPMQENPLWLRQSTNSRSGPDTWRCVECHGWDYKGAEGAYATGSHYTGFPNVKYLSEQMSIGEIINHLQGGKDPAHDFSTYIPEVQLRNVAIFLKYGLIDDDLYIDDISLKVIAGDVTHGQELFELVCSQCHGEDGKTIVFREEGVDEYLGTVANRDPWRFLHRTRFGTAGTSMPIGHAFGWTPEDGRDVLAYAQTLPTGLDESKQSQASEAAEPASEIGGPAQTFGQGILTGLAAFIGTFGASVLFLSVLVGIGVVVVILLRRR